MACSQIIVNQPWFRSGCTLGEGPLYDPKTSILHFVDISEKRVTYQVFHLNTKNQHLEVEQFDEAVSCLALRKNGQGLACAASQGFAILEGDSSLKYLNRPLSIDHIPHIRFNDGACDSSGRFFAGTIFNEGHDIAGRLFRYDPLKEQCLVVDEGPFTDSNGLGWSPDEKIFYFTDSLTNKIYAYDYNDGELSNRRVFVDAIAQGFPENTFCDGLCVDDKGYVWSARWGGSQILRFTPEGTVDIQIIFPTALNITACCFGGPNNDQLYVTTAHCGANGGDATRQVQYPDSGHLFVVDLSGKYRGGHRYKFAG
ncbi:hypothetical protein BDZ94DRAFT_1290988 [Collybia nuda]|uniref:SMP-30/Gluconolactonase/LRE-like region domain-containing protein n=1 Tax=Collybia nuda TaxID=64659 RepID=A0A9P6CG30_9AGAR|nr:hypothetical protein BDZ94DRAFT_1290988 [Collybia nuda]